MAPCLIHPTPFDCSQLLKANFMRRIPAVWIYRLKVDKNALSSTGSRIYRFPYMMLWNVLGCTWFFRRWIWIGLYTHNRNTWFKPAISPVIVNIRKVDEAEQIGIAIANSPRL